MKSISTLINDYEKIIVSTNVTIDDIKKLRGIVEKIEKKQE